MTHAVHTKEKATSVSTPVAAESGIPFVVGTAPIYLAKNPAKVGVPVLITSWDEAVEKLGYSDDWAMFTLCEFMYSHFKLYACQPVIMVNVYDPEKEGKMIMSDTYGDVVDKKVNLGHIIIDDTLDIVSGMIGAEGPDPVGTVKRGTDYDAFYDGDNVIVELISEKLTHYTRLLFHCNTAILPENIEDEIAAGFESAELCFTLLGIVPDLICCPKYSSDSEIAAIMAAKASSINGLFSAKALCDIKADDYQAAVVAKKAANLVQKEQITFWPMTTLGERVFHLSTAAAGSMSRIDAENGSIPYESPSNKNISVDGLCYDKPTTKDKKEVILTHAQANFLNDNGIVTALNFIGGFVLWGNCTACYPANTDVKDNHIPVSRMFSWVGASLIRTFWSKLDRPMTRRLVDSILDTANIWLNGLVSRGYLLGARVEMIEAENPVTDLMQGIVRLHVYMTPPSATQEIEFTLEYDANYVQAAFGA